MASSSQLRLMSDLKSIVNEPPEGCSASPLSDENLYVWSATIFGPDESPWEGGVFGLRLIFGDHYPEKPPRVRFTSEIFHPNDQNNSLRSSMDNNVAIMINNIANLVPVKLTRDNYFLWKSLFLPILRSHDALGFVDGTNVCPPKFLVAKDGKVTDSVNPLYKLWDHKDQALLACLNATISESLLPYVVGLPTSRDLWVILEQRYSTISLAHKTRLKSNLRTIKKGDSSMGEYLDSIKQISDKLAAAGCPLDDADLVFHILNGLPEEYEALHFSVLYRPKPISVDGLYDLLLSGELSSDVRTKVRLHSDGSTHALATANSSNTQGQDKNSLNNKGRGKGNYRGGYSNTNYCSNTNQPSYYNGKNVSPDFFPNPPSTCNSNLPTCQICNEVGHTADYCHNRMDHAYQGRIPSQELAAMEAQNTTQGNYWYADTGATHHLTSSLSNFSIHSD